MLLWQPPAPDGDVSKEAGAAKNLARSSSASFWGRRNRLRRAAVLPILPAAPALEPVLVLAFLQGRLSSDTAYFFRAMTNMWAAKFFAPNARINIS
jgi:hypothetical protein